MHGSHGPSTGPLVKVGLPPSGFHDLRAREAAYMEKLGVQDTDFAIMQTGDRDAGCYSWDKHLVAWWPVHSRSAPTAPRADGSARPPQAGPAFPDASNGSIIDRPLISSSSSAWRGHPSGFQTAHVKEPRQPVEHQRPVQARVGFDLARAVALEPRPIDAAPAIGVKPSSSRDEAGAFATPPTG